MKTKSEFWQLDRIAEEIAMETAKLINQEAVRVPCPNMPYKAQYVLEQVIKSLEKRV